METAAIVRVQLLGGFRVELPNRSVAGPWQRPSARRLFQVVVTRDRRRIGREELAELLFPDLAPERAANAVSKALTMARSALSPFPVVQADRDVIWIDGAIEVDADAARAALRHALSQPPGDARDAALVSALRDRGRLLDDELYSDWAATERDALEGLRADAAIVLARDRSAGHGRCSAHSVVDAWSDVIARDRSNEEACSVLMATYADLGQRDQVLRTYHRTVASLHQLGLDPSEALGALYAEAVETAGTGRSSASTVPSLRTTFGRDATLGGLLEAVIRPHRGSAPTVLVTGPPGIGKSHAVDALRRDLVAAGWTVAHAGGVPGDTRAPLRALCVLLAQLDHERAQGLVRRLASVGESPDLEGDGARAALVREVRLALDHQAERAPFAVTLDDVQWMDIGLQGILTDLINESSNRRWAVVLAARSGDAGLVVTPPPATRRFQLAPLAVDATEGLVRHTSPWLSDGRVRRVAARSGGNPFFAIELARQGTAVTEGTPPDDAAVPQLIVDLLETRLARCSEGARRVMSLVALLGEDASVQVILRLDTQPGVETGPDVTMDALDELLMANLLEESTGGVRVAHPLLRDASLASLSPVRRAALHCRIAPALEGEAAARHFLGAFEASGLRQHAGHAADAGFRAGQRARRLFSDDAALDLLAGGLRAFEAMPAVERADLSAAAVEAWLQIGEIHQEGDRPADAESALDAALALAGTDEDRIRVWSAKGSLAYRNGDFATAVLAYERGIASLVEPSPLVRARMQADLGWIYARQGRGDDAVSILGPATAVLAELGDAGTAGHALDQMATALGTAGRAEEGLVTMQRAFALVGPTGNERQLGVLHLHRAALYGMLLRFGEALADIASSLRIARSCGDRYRESVIHWMTADIHERRGDPAAALAERDAELVLLVTIGNPRNGAAAHAARARLLTTLGRHEEAAQAAARARAVAQSVEDQGFSASIEQLVKAQPLAF